jgi:sugar-specific transcriptional regulator TrmB
MLIKHLIEFGLSEKEAKVYVTLLELEVATANEIAQKSAINRSSTYVVLESLKKHGFVNMSEDKTVKQYIATPPDMLLGLAKNRAEKQENIRAMIEEIMPDLKALHKGTKHKPKVMVYEGADSVKALYYGELLKHNDDWRTYENPSEIDRHFPGYFEKDCLERKKSGVNLYGINPNTKENQELMKKNKSMDLKDENLLISTNKFKFPNQPIDFAVYGDEVTFSSLQGSFAIVIKQQEIADTLKNIFDLAWEEARRLNKFKP